MNMALPLDAVGEREHALDVSRRAIAIGVDLGDVALQAEGHFNAARIHFDRGEYRRAIDLFRWNVQALQGDLVRFGTPGVASVLSRTWLAWSHASLGEFPDALSAAEEGLRIAEAIGQPYSWINAYLGVGWTHLYKGEFSQAVSRIDEALTVNRSSNIEAFRTWGAVFLGLALGGAGARVRRCASRERRSGSTPG
jgi:tetratricopeptide (TPR) repeat protein